MLCTHKTASSASLVIQKFVPTLLTHISPNSRPFLVGIVSPMAPWSGVHADCIGPWTVTVNNINLKPLPALTPSQIWLRSVAFQDPRCPRMPRLFSKINGLHTTHDHSVLSMTMVLNLPATIFNSPWIMWASLPSRLPPTRLQPTLSLNLSIILLDRSFVHSFILSPPRLLKMLMPLSTKPSPLPCTHATSLPILLSAISPWRSRFPMRHVP